MVLKSLNSDKNSPGALRVPLLKDDEFALDDVASEAHADAVVAASTAAVDPSDDDSITTVVDDDVTPTFAKAELRKLLSLAWPVTLATIARLALNATARHDSARTFVDCQ